MTVCHLPHLLSQPVVLLGELPVSSRAVSVLLPMRFAVLGSFLECLGGSFVTVRGCFQTLGRGPLGCLCFLPCSLGALTRAVESFVIRQPQTRFAVSAGVRIGHWHVL
jgi:hypothetical protein